MKIGLKQWLSILLKREIYLMLLIYLFVLIPLAYFLVWLGVKLDKALGFLKFIGRPWNIVCFLFFILTGLFIVWWSYTYLILEGTGSPATMLGQTKKLVKKGPYAFVRNPSVIGKLLGVVGLGCLSGSFSFTFIIVPLLLFGSLLEKRFHEERNMERLWGQEYIDYKEAVPMVIPRFDRILRELVSFFRKKKHDEDTFNQSA